VSHALIEREEARAWLESALGDAVAGQGSLVLISGEAGIGKTGFVEWVVESADAQLLRGAAGPSQLAYGPIVAALRGFMRTNPGGLAACGPLRPHLALLLPELGDAVTESDRATLFEAIRCALATAASARPLVLLLDDLQASDETTLELLAALAEPLSDLPILVIAAYRSDEIPREHGVRRLRDQLRRAGALRERTLEPLSEAGTAELAARVLDEGLSPRLARTLHQRTNGIPFFVEELAAGLDAGGRLQRGDDGLDLALDAEVPMPQTIRDAVVLRFADLTEQARTTAEAASVAGTSVDLDLLNALDCANGLDELMGTGLLFDPEWGRAAFRHPLTRDAIYEDIPWLRRRSLHRQLATAIEARGGHGAEVAAHWLAARDEARALSSLLVAIDELARVHAYRDATELGRQALDLWPDAERRGDRILALERHASFAELSGELAEAGRAQREVIAARRSEGAGRALADAERRLAKICELQGDRERALAARRVAAEAYSANGFPGEAAAERLIAAGYLQSSGRHGDAVELTRRAVEEAAQAERADLRARALGLQGVALVKGGEFEAGMRTVQEGLSLALEHELTLVAAEVYQRLGTAREIAGDYGGAHDALATAVSFCETDTGGSTEYTCLSCMAYVLRELGDWERAAELCEDLRGPDASADDTLVADGVLGSIHAFRGQCAAARPLLAQCLATGTRLDVVSMSVDSAAALAWLDELEGDLDGARGHCRFLLERWARSEDHHYAVWGLRWAASFFARHGSLPEARACAEALSRIAATTGHPDVLAALAHALGETALADGHPDVAAAQLRRAVELHEAQKIPFERAQIQLRAGVALTAAGERGAALEQLKAAYDGARKLGCAPVAVMAAEQVAGLGESVERTLGRRAAAERDHAGLSRRELEVMQLVASGRTNREIAEQLVLSRRTIDMHVRNILAKLDCRSRTEAATRATELGLIA
jgi:predicted ATPase/DNA-binding NarL/FixJ family response regulator